MATVGRQALASSHEPAAGIRQMDASTRVSSQRYLRNISPGTLRDYIISMSTGTGHAKYRCANCEKAEEQCDCEKFCVLCQSQLDIRICQDGPMYCEPCRNACDYKTSD